MSDQIYRDTPDNKIYRDTPDNKIYRDTPDNKIYRDTPGDQIINTEKRGCSGFPCVYTHMAERAGRASIERYIAQLIQNCMHDASCNPGIFFF